MTFTLGIPDEQFEQRIPRRGLITKMEVRVVSLARLNLRPGATVWDIGTATGSVAIEAARIVHPGQVLAIEKNPESVAMARRNAARFGVDNLEIRQGKAPEGLADWPDPDAVFIGGSSGALSDLVRLTIARMKPGGRLVVNLATLENLHESVSAIRSCGWQAEVTMMQVSRSRPVANLTRFEALDPVYIVMGMAPPEGTPLAPAPKGAHP